MKTCKTCGVEKSLSEFYLNNTTHSYAAHCKRCYNIRCVERQRASRKADPEKWRIYDKRAKEGRPKETQWKYSLKSKYNISVEQYQSILTEQSYGCAICGKPEPRNGHRLAVDHDHTCCPGTNSCGKCVRGLLCGPCNRGLGQFSDSRQTVHSALSYLEKYASK